MSGSRLHRFDMALTFEELRRLAPHLVEGGAIDFGDRSVTGSWPEHQGRWTIALGPERERVIALFRFPVVEATLRLDGFDDAEEARFLARFHRVFQKGGG